ncbi:MAG: hypothetical protein MJZ52_05165 [Bacteroidales bacterium]|nr:hypothetical protein [Bacteroidales bacterium]
MENTEILQQVPKKNPFQVPENYFDDLENDVMAKVRQEQKVVKHRKIYTIAAAVAAVAVLVIVLNIGLFSTGNDTQNQNLAENAVNTDQKLLASANDNDITATYDPIVVIEESNLDNVDYQIIDYYDDEMSEDYLY